MKKILLIEDNEIIRENTAEILELAGYAVRTAENGKMGVELALQEVPHLVICDISMPVLDGFGVLHIFNKTENLAGVPFIFLTAKTERSDFRKGMELGADDYITKPFQEIELLNAIESRLKKMEQFKQAGSSAEKWDNFVKEANSHYNLQLMSDDRKIYPYKKKQIIYSEGNDPSKLFYLKKGKVKTCKINADGKEFVTGIYKDGDFFGYLALIEGKPYEESALVLEDAELALIPREDFMNLLYKNLSVAEQFIQMLANNVAEKETQLLGMAYDSLRKRVADALLFLNQKYKTDSQSTVAIQISRDDLAAIVGTATESLIRMLSEFKQDKLIEIVDNKIVIINERKLQSLKY
jgi:CRP-like cAMP-binding protein/CheY-like chemotaxis protein